VHCRLDAIGMNNPRGDGVGLGIGQDYEAPDEFL
jgi:hypothetical protein